MKAQLGVWSVGKTTIQRLPAGLLQPITLDDSRGDPLHYRRYRVAVVDITADAGDGGLADQPLPRTGDRFLAV
jgi:hypothetical protein